MYVYIYIYIYIYVAAPVVLGEHGIELEFLTRQKCIHTRQSIFTVSNSKQVYCVLNSWCVRRNLSNTKIIILTVTIIIIIIAITILLIMIIIIINNQTNKHSLWNSCIAMAAIVSPRAGSRKSSLGGMGRSVTKTLRALDESAL